MIDAIVENTVVVEPVVEPAAEPVVEPAAEPTIDTDPSFAASQEPVIEDAPIVDPAPAPVTEPEFKKDDDECNKDGDKDPEGEPAQKDNDEDDDKKKYELLKAEHEDLQAQFSKLQEEHDALVTAHEELVEFKRQSDDAKKDEMIDKFYMLSEDDKKDIIANKANYTVEEIEEKLSVICFRKKVNFDLENNSNFNNITEPVVTSFSLTGVATETNKPAWLSAVDQYKKNI